MINGETPRRLVPGITLKIGLPLLIGLITLAGAQAGGMSGRNSLVLAAIITFAVALILFIVDTEIRISAVNDGMVKGFAQVGKSAEVSAMMEHSVLGAALLADFLETAGRADGRVNPLLQRLARREVERVTSFCANCRLAAR